MNTLHRSLFLGIALSLGACATTGQVVGPASAQGVAESESAPSQHTERTRREFAAVAPGGERDDAVAFARLDHGIPTPQPARDPISMSASERGGPVPVPPLPSRGGSASRDTGW